MKTDFEMLDQIIESLSLKQNGRFSLKVVVFDDEDLAYAKKVHYRYPMTDLFIQVGNDDLETASEEELLAHLLARYEKLIDQVMADNELKHVRVLPQLHTYLWGNKRGV